METYEPIPNDCRDTDFDEFENYPCDLCEFIDYTDNPPPGLFDSEEEKAGNPFCETILRKIGGTWYIILGSSVAFAVSAVLNNAGRQGKAVDFQ